MKITIPKEKLDKAELLIDLRIYDIIESVDGAFLYSYTSNGNRVEIKGLDFYPCVDKKSEDLVYIARTKTKVYKIVFPEVTNDEINVLSKFNQYTKRVNKFNPNFLRNIIYAIIAASFITYMIYDYLSSTT